ncbi:putative bifunctional diguanylate cyclase/phosphodiesterase [Cellulomonas endometrii]|uniref:putative bifunctional diguanylate cyclase/phosphodiesterase n=1 Tax=Cellulomonas endometrii TaxID=3036301 RepID=UPI0024AE52D9|nr:bifunctional diguanylate cyclase/phosphodiesterase [Cellulomonas endometrii]
MTGTSRATTPRLLAAAGAGLVVHALMPGGTGRDVVYVGVCLAAAVTLARATWRVTGPQRRAWQLLTLGLLAWVLGDTVWTVMERGLGLDPFPSVADVAYVASYPLLAAGLVRAFPAPPNRRPVWLLDAFMVASGGLLMLWVLVLNPALSGFAEAPLATLVGAAYPVGDAVLLVVLARSFAAVGAWSRAHQLTSLSVLVIMAADVLYQLGAYWPAIGDRAYLLDTLWLLGYVLLAAAARHPSAAAVVSPRPTGELTGVHIAFLSASVAVLPGTLLVEALRGGDLHLVEVCSVGIALMVAFMTRFGGLVREMHRQHARLEHLAVTDPLTGLASSVGLAVRVERPASEAPDGTVPALLLVSLDGYREVVETLGYGVGDDLLRSVAAAVAADAEPGATVGRMGRDVFGVALDVTGPDEAEACALRLLETLRAPLPVRGMDLTAGALVGVAVATARPAGSEGLVARADAALSVARRVPERVALDRTGGCDASGTALPEADLLRGLADGVARGELVVHFQPVVAVRGGAVAGAEALVRWQHPEHGLLGPVAFVPAAERTGLVRPVTLFVLDAALAQCARWRSAAAPSFVVSVNVSAHDLDDPRLVADVRDALARHDLPADALGIEVTETMAMRDGVQAERTLRALADLGVQLAVDDYGVGYGSLDYLRRLPFTVLKVDRAFVAPALDDRVCAEILRSTVDLGHALGMQVVAEGVEDPRTLALLRDLGCDAAQGWALGRPEPAAAMDALLAAAGRQRGVVEPRTGEPTASAASTRA